jgi:hypothetical protein
VRVCMCVCVCVCFLGVFARECKCNHLFGLSASRSGICAGEVSDNSAWTLCFCSTAALLRDLLVGVLLLLVLRSVLA